MVKLVVSAHLDEEQDDDQRERQEQPDLAHGGGARKLACFARLLCLDDERLLAHARTEQVVTRAREMMRTMDPCAEANL